MASPALPKGITVSFSNTPQAKDDVFGLNESAETNISYLDVMANDLGGNAKSLYSLDDSIGSGGSNGDLLNKDAVGAINYSKLGAKIWITADGKVAYDASTLELDHLAAGQHLTDTFTYAIRMANGAISWATATVDIVGQNDGPVAVDDANSADEDTIITGSVATNDSDIDDGETATLSYALNAPVAGLQLNTDGSYTFDAGDAAYQHLPAGVTTEVVAHYTVTDVHGATATATLTIQVHGVNDEASIAGTLSGDVTEDSGDVNESATITVSDVDDGEDELLANSGDTTHGSYVVTTAGWSFTADNDALQHLGEDDTATDTFVITSADGTASETVSITLHGVNDEASISEASAQDTSVTEDDAGNNTAGGFLAVSDVDDGEDTFLATDNGSHEGDYGTFTFNSSTGQWSYVLDNTNPDVQALTAASDPLIDTLTVHSADGTDEYDIDVSINGSNDVQTATGQVTFTVTRTGNGAHSGSAAISEFSDPDNFNFVLTGATVTGFGDYDRASESFLVTGDISASAGGTGNGGNELLDDTVTATNVTVVNLGIADGDVDYSVTFSGGNQANANSVLFGSNVTVTAN